VEEWKFGLIFELVKEEGNQQSDETLAEVITAEVVDQPMPSTSTDGGKKPVKKAGYIVIVKLLKILFRQRHQLGSKQSWAKLNLDSI